MDFHYIWVYVTTESKEEAQKIGDALVEERMAACANIIAEMESVYQWQQKIERGKECILILKSKISLFQDLNSRVKQLHSSTTPCVIALPIIDGNPEYLDWIEAETK